MKLLHIQYRDLDFNSKQKSISELEWLNQNKVVKTNSKRNKTAPSM